MKTISDKQIMNNLADSVSIFKNSLLGFVERKHSDKIISGLSYKEYCIQEAIFCLIEMERSTRTLLHLPIQDQKQIIFWAVQMRDEAKRILKHDFEIMYNIVLNGCEDRNDNQ